MFEFTKEEQNKMTETRKNFNQDKMQADVKDKGKKMFGMMFNKKKGDSARGNGSRNESFNSGGNNTSKH